MDVACVTGAHALMRSANNELKATSLQTGLQSTINVELGTRLVATTDYTIAIAEGNSVSLYDCDTGRHVVTLPLKVAPVFLALGEQILVAATACDDKYTMSVMYLTADYAGLVQDIPIPSNVTAITARERETAVLLGHESGLVAEYVLRPSAAPTVRAATERLLLQPPVVLVDDGAGGVITATETELQLWQPPDAGAKARCKPHEIAPGILGVVKGEHSAWLRYAGYCQQLGTAKRRRVTCNGARGATIVNEQLIVCTTNNRLGTVKCFL